MIGNHQVYLVAACDKQRGIGKAGKLPWHLKKEMAYFKNLTTAVTDVGLKNMVVMGRATWESIPDKFRPLPERNNVILSRNTKYVAEGAAVASSFDEAIQLVDDSVDRIFVIGGGAVYNDTITHPAVDGVYLTEIDYTFQCDTFFPELPPGYARQVLKSGSEGDISFTFSLYARN
ncbi:MAG: hypothetical protein COW24_05045 [Candidatus Kerfeldbacteria bacterium CG15_BIG_FIL_POST_REV_8_21_14_020_45_12]|uniref:dihydrofolate reductase n=1 Tax=Candidatus Kerfeldbacteria bacterium CG15_BIG_FIL_POST_REV_8_21_14_020_45_12 TaxID=2014247 RepID=A0A2M7H2S5_9BACT|nr:MAG: hypothetical protein COW24_05045 [Candidatus Kerfeldbacteria bacterium CG15_BIG_FIL_POST_REV_8_21_14_020_45_12]PJA93221.1 MAG: hypothetical protein CO132_03870 [Candidatus Kerfeldbacteria bacterium CG_4_9_14_3_um_filter_45_8]